MSSDTLEAAFHGRRNGGVAAAPRLCYRSPQHETPTPRGREWRIGFSQAVSIILESSESVRKPWAIVPPNGVAFAISGFTWMN